MRVGFLLLGIVLSIAPVTRAGQPVLTVTDSLTVLGQSLEISIILDNPVADANGWAYGICHAESQLELIATGLGADGSTVNNGAEPDWAQILEYPEGWTVAVVVNLIGATSLPTGNGFEIGVATYLGLAVGDSEICSCDTLGAPPIATVVVYSGASIAPIQICGTATVDPMPPPEFRRGDANSDGFIDVGDAVYILQYLFSSGPPAACEEAIDIDASGQTDIADPVALLAHLFNNGTPPAPPYPDCGLVAGADCDQPNCP